MISTSWQSRFRTVVAEAARDEGTYSRPPEVGMNPAPLSTRLGFVQSDKYFQTLS